MSAPVFAIESGERYSILCVADRSAYIVRDHLLNRDAPFVRLATARSAARRGISGFKTVPVGNLYAERVTSGESADALTEATVALGVRLEDLFGGRK